ncbi:universal stress protein [Planctomicrobium piriforme]|uniref:Nucleotide-binding universal stress protein, UspA family n=1 Tax=Planctomicrobium piriforme TaxID=1576369 RepID=A0A1I3B3R9_9PLAN|nr:universal stress protein [Planctomicrobium piriforme]SFH56934.1 Nucleotide-binding universal stress protein, UspA family [Planctomicrobium piriforme]
MKLLVAVDGSKSSADALAFLEKFPFAQKPDVIVAHTCPVPNLTEIGVAVPSQIQQEIERSRAEGWEIAKKAAIRCESWAKAVKAELLGGPAAAREIVDAAAREQVELIVLGARGLGAVSRFLLGSVSDSVAKHAPCSVLVVRPPQADRAQRGARIMFAVDGSEASHSAVRRFAALPLGKDAEILVMTVVDTVQAYHTEYTLQRSPALTSLLERTRSHLEADVAQLKAATANIRTVLKEKSDAAAYLLDEVDRWKPDLLVVGNTGKTGWERVLMGSVSTRLLHHAPCSVWVERLRK